MNCPYCESENIQKRGFRGERQRYWCKDCDRFFMGDAENDFDAKKEKEDSSEENSSYEQADDSIRIVCASKRMMTADDVLEQFNVDINVWRIEKFKVKTSEGYRKDRKVNWKVRNGEVISGDVDDTGKMLVVPLYHIEVLLTRRIEEIRVKNIIEELIEEAKKYSFSVPILKYPVSDNGTLYEVDIPDIHFGRLTWNEESGEDYDVKLAGKVVNDGIEKLLSYVSSMKLSRILLPIGNDFFNVNSKTNTTVRGTPQQEDTRWQKTFRLGLQLARQMVDRCSAIAPVDVLVVQGNHDTEKTFYLGEALNCWYHNNENVKIDNRAMSRKYYQFEKNMIGFTHGSEEKIEKLPILMALESPTMWGKTSHREFHLGDKHHKKDLFIKSNNGAGVMIRILRSLTAADAWTFDKGFVGGERACEGLLWHPEDGVIAQYTALAK